MSITILYDRLFNDGSKMEEEHYIYCVDEWDVSLLPDAIATLYKSFDNKGINIKITNIIIDRDC